MIAALLSIAIALSGGLEDARQFDLVCQGSTRTVVGPEFSSHWSWHLSVDLDANRWCGRAHDCSDVYRIASVQGDVIEFAHRSTYYDSLGIVFERSTGRMAWSYDYNARATYVSEGTCSIAPFTAFPASSRMLEETGPEIESPP